MRVATQGIQSPSVSQELRLAITAASMGRVGASRDVALPQSDLPSLVPSGATLEITSVKFSDLKMGDLICVRVGSSIAVRRFVKTRMTQADTYLLTAREGFDKKEVLTRSCLLGRVDCITAGGRTFDPTIGEGVFKKFWDKLTEYGTHKAFGIFAA